MTPRCQTCHTPCTDPDRPPGWNVPYTRCAHCPPHQCDQCGQDDHVNAPCDCWHNVGDIPPADLKAMLAQDGIGVGPDGVLHTTGSLE